jgi:hypothetical protein
MDDSKWLRANLAQVIVALAQAAAALESAPTAINANTNPNVR